MQEGGEGGVRKEKEKGQQVKVKLVNLHTWVPIIFRIKLLAL